MNLVAAILILSASGHAERSMESTDTIAGIVAQCGKGLFDVFAASTGSSGSGLGNLAGMEASGVRLAIDGQPREGLRAWGEAAWRVGGYAVFDAPPVRESKPRHVGSVGYSYRLRIRNYDVRRATRIENGRVVLTTDAWWTEVVPVGRSTRRIPIHVRIRVLAQESRGVTRISGVASGTADTSDFRCGLVRRIAEREAARSLAAGLPKALATIECEGRQFYASGSDIAGVLDRIRLGIKIGGRLRR